MKKKIYTIEEEKIKLLVQVFERLGQVEVKGDSVEHLLTSKLTIKQVVESISELDIQKELELEAIKDKEEK